MFSLLRKINRKWFYSLLYLGHPPWDTGIVPPEVVDFAENQPPGSALDLGCGPGVSSIYLATKGWKVVGIDFIGRAIREARNRASQAGLSPDHLPEFRLGDVTVLEHLREPSSVPYDLVLDIGCFHSLPPAAQFRYVDNLDELLALGGSFLMYGFPQTHPGGPGLSEALLKRLEERLRLVQRLDGSDHRRPSAWFHYRRELA